MLARGGQGLEGTCLRCPVVVSVNKGMLSLFGIPVRGREEMIAMNKVIREHTSKLMSTLQVAEATGCIDTAKDLPTLPETIPLNGSVERETYMRQCPAYVVLQSILEQN